MLRNLGITTVCWLFFGGPSAIAQDVTNVNSSIKIIAGEAYYLHTVLEGQSLDAITQAYFSTTAAVLNANPGVSLHPTAGSSIRIPYTDASAEAMSAGAAVVPKKEPVVILQDGTVRASSTASKQVATTAAAPPAPKAVEPAAPLPSKIVEPERGTSASLAPPVQEETPPEQAVAETPQPEASGSELPVTTEIKEPELTESPLPEPPAPAEEVSVDQLTPLAEAARLIDQEMKEDTVHEAILPGTAQPEQATETNAAVETATLMNDLGTLSKNINESIANLEKLKETIESTPDGNAIPEVGRTVTDFDKLLNAQYTRFFDSNATDSLFYMREFFMVHTDNRNHIRRIQDERTQTNQNTHHLNPDDLRGLQVSDSLMQRDFSEPLALGLEMVMLRYDYDLKIKKTKIRVYREPMFVEYLPEEHPHAILLREIAGNRNERGRCHAVIYDGQWNLNTYTSFEYNPFGKMDRKLATAHVLKVESIEFN